ncbi:MAG: PD40 domain-containing protein [Anaerolineae bacterium]|nr:PD40 domain-containing protein [Anaerolineae bacterium]
MGKRLAGTSLLFVAALAAGILAQAGQTSGVRPAPPAVTSSDLAGRTALWVVDEVYDEGSGVPAARLVAVDSQTGEALLEISPPHGQRVTTRDGRWQYAAESVWRNGAWNALILKIDRQRGALTKIFPLPSSPPASPSGYRDPAVSLALTGDGRRLAVTITEHDGTNWLTSVRAVGTEGKETAQTTYVFSDNAKDRPLVRAVLSGDGRRLILAQNRQRQTSAREGPRSFWTTQIAIVNLERGRIEHYVDVPGEVEATDIGLDTFLSPDGEMLYLIQNFVRGNREDGYRFVAFATNKGTFVHTQRAEQEADGKPFWFCGEGRRFTPDGRYLLGYCHGDPQQPQGYFQFLDTQTGLIAQEVRVESKGARQNAWVVPQIVASPDGRLLYVANGQTKEVSVLDLEQRAVVRGAALSVPLAAPANPLDWLARQLIGTASAKMMPTPSAAILSPDGRRLYFMDDGSDAESRHGIWAVDTASLRASGRWLRGDPVSDLRLSDDGRELYAASATKQTLYVLDANNGQTLRTFPLAMQWPRFDSAE